MLKTSNMVNKTLVVGVIVLFVGTSIIPMTSSLILKKEISADNKIPVISGVSSMNVLYVGGYGGNNYTSIQDAIDDANEGDTVFVYDDSSPYYENLIVDKSINLIGEDKYTTQINGSGIDELSVIFVVSPNVTISGFNIENSGASPFYYDSGIRSNNKKCNFSNNYITFNKLGIFLNSCRENNVSNNIIFDNRKDSGYGIYIHGNGYHSISNNLISKNLYNIVIVGTKYNFIWNNEIINSTTHNGIWAQRCNHNIICRNNIIGNNLRGIDFYNCDNNIIDNNTIIGNGLGTENGTVGADGISLRVDSTNNIIKNNFIKENKYDGISIYGDDCSYNQIFKNTIIDNDRYGFQVKPYNESSYINNTIYNNNFINNPEYNAVDPGINNWNETHPFGGNFWDDYYGEDNDGDGIGDTPYNISDGENKDYYPLINKMGENAPFANFTYSGNLTVTLDASVALDRDGKIVKYEWVFGDGNNGTGRIINNTYPDYKSYNVTLTVTDNDGKVHSATKIIEVIHNLPPNTPDTPFGPTYLLIGEIGTYSTNTIDPNGDMIQYRFDWDARGSHEYSNWTEFVPSGDIVSLNHTWDSNGKYQVATQARDDCGNKTLWGSPLSVLINTLPNQPFNPIPEMGAINVEINTTLSWSCDDPDGDPLTYNVYLEANDSTPGILVSENQTENTFYPSLLEYNTTYYWQIIAKDEHGACTSGSIWYFTTEVNKPPDAPDIDGPKKGKKDISYNFTFNSVDPDSDFVHYFINWGDGFDTGWIGPYPSGVDIDIVHTYKVPNIYTIEAKSRDVSYDESNWSYFDIEIPRTRKTPYIWYELLFELFSLLEKLLNLIR